MRLRHIEVFNAVMQTGSVSAAARLINVTQPAVSRTLQHAELQLGFALFERARGRLTPTNEAMALFPHVEKLYEQLDEVQRLAAGLRHGAVTDRLQVLTVFALSREVLPHAVAGFRQRYPQVQVTVQALHTPQVVSGLLLQEADVGFVISSAGQHALERESLAEVDMHCIVPKGLLPPSRIKPAGMALQDLADLPVVALDARDPLGMRINQACREHGVGLSPVVTVQTYHAALSMAEYGLGIAIVDGCTASAADKRKVHVLPLLPRITVSVNALHLAQRPSSVLARAMTQEMRKALRELL
ncbi:LysR substrate-binding domain-containing protein [Comamonas aquatica]|jgi:DNA-binding transcriptional LysR family regulator|uniref:Ben and cat operon transcriptional regulator n=1 Tax=Comamonas aquatica TaxID=225991 RepID=A0AA35GEI8_9BURK|nr:MULTISPECIES: LysR substrate-binding domain-containing protein [Comamonas]MDH0494487.1 LysR substrate-binding domain-containing protein [Comamonas aquatica]MDH1812915.1 LysR substrate-binding domain-containing protein [Comamonas aquatica]MDH1903069.1 LysR substrate-binding domain-containing protein [Comamonas aquatica]MRT20893.1 LysR family transcriptional regulator [Comamonas sp. CAH-2]WBM42142.1 LysR substrate-binding domain-containing protein [Comamonas aquatica]